MMDIESFRVRLASPLETARGSITDREGFLISVSHEGVYGVGEATPLSGWTESYQECHDALQQAATIAEQLDWGIALTKTDPPAARHGLSLAFAEARSRAATEPLYRYLGSDHPVEAVPVNETLGARGSPAEMAEQAREAVEAGYQCLKLKVGTNGLEEDIERVRAVRTEVGDDIELRVDANGAWSFERAQRALEAFAALDISYVEQPLPTGKLDKHAQLRGSDVDVALDESLAFHDVSDIIDADAADVLVLKPMILGGVDRAREMALRAREAGIDPIVSTTVDAVVARTGAVHVAAAIPDVRPCGLATADMLETDLAPDSAPVRDGSIVVPQESGLGLAKRPT